MNCKKGDLCFVLSGKVEGHSYYQLAVDAARDRIVRVVEYRADEMWQFETPIEVSGNLPDGAGTFRAVIAAASDDCLRPIRGLPDDDEAIETTAHLKRQVEHSR